MKGGASLDRRGFDALVTKVQKNVGGIRLTVGVHRGTQNKSTDIALYAAANNFGVKKNGVQRIPPRPFMTYSADRIAKYLKSAKYERLVAKLVKGEITRDAFMRIVGGEVQELTRATIRDSSLYAKNAKSTMARKGSIKPLIAGGTMLQTVVWRKG